MHEKQAYVRPVSDVKLLEFTFDLTIVSYIVVIYKQDFIIKAVSSDSRPPNAKCLTATIVFDI